MEEHIGFEELTKFVWIRQLNEETMALSLRVNRHLLLCADCAHRVEQLQRIYEDAQSLRQRRAQLNLANRKLREVNETILPQYGKFRSSRYVKDD